MRKKIERLICVGGERDGEVFAIRPDSPGLIAFMRSPGYATEILSDRDLFEQELEKWAPFTSYRVQEILGVRLLIHDGYTDRQVFVHLLRGHGKD